MPSRYGGDEFILILPDATQEATRERAELIYNYAKQFHLQFEGKTLEAIILSMGIANFPETGLTGAEILKVADHPLYQAKRAGRGRILTAV